MLNKLTLSLLFLSILLSLTAVDIGIKYDLISHHPISKSYLRDSGDDEAIIDKDKHGYSMYLEDVLKVNKMYSLGLGVQYQLLRKLNVHTVNYLDTYSFVPVYLVNKVSIPNKYIQTDFIFDFGYNFLTTSPMEVNTFNLRGGYYCGMGFEVKYKRAFVRALYEIDQGYIDNGIKLYSVVNRQTGISIGMDVGSPDR